MLWNREESKSDGGSSDRGSTSWTFSISHRLGVHASDLNPWRMRKYDFRFLTPGGNVSFYRRGFASLTGISSSATESDPLVAWGKQCVLSLRPERCFTKPEGEKGEKGGESARGQRAADRRNLEEPRVRSSTGSGDSAHSGVMRTGVWEAPRASTAPPLTERGWSEEPQLTAACRMVRGCKIGHQETPECSDGVNPILHPFLPRSDPSDSAHGPAEDEDMRKAEQGLDAEADGQETVQQDLTEQEITTKRTQHDVSDDRRGDWRAGKDEKWSGGLTTRNMMDVVSTENEHYDTHRKITEELDPPENDEEQERRSDVILIPAEPPSQQKPGTSHIRASKSKSLWRQTLSASALLLPCVFTSPPSSPTTNFYRPSFGIKPPYTPTSQSTQVKRTSKHAKDRRPNTGTKTRDVSSVQARGTRPKIMSSVRGSASRKTKTTKTFEWGPDGPQETKCVSELHACINRCRGSD